MSVSAEAARERDDRAADRVPGDPYASDPARPATSARGPWWRWLFVLRGLTAAGYPGPMTSLEEGIGDYVSGYLSQPDPYR